MRVGIEVGGTFTDLVAVDGDRVEVVKVASTPHSPDIGAFNALKAAGIEPRNVIDLVHGSTVATNAILERKGANVAFVTTKGFRDILFFQRHDRRNIYDLRYKKPAPPLRRKDCFEVAERLDARGNLVLPLDERQVVDELIPSIAEGRYQAVAICLLSAYLAPAHEAKVKELISRHLPQVRIACSHEVAREFREYERSTTTVLSAYVQPVIDSYLARFEETLAGAGFIGGFSVMQSNGGRLPSVAMRRNSITALFSGPAAGVVGAIGQGARSSRSNLITFDMGGTSTDVCLIVDGVPSSSPETEVDGLPIRTPVLDIATVGAGGGSTVWIDDGGMLRVGPQSAGASPGPACYGRGGSLPTVTDAHVVRGTIRPKAFLGGAMPLDVDSAHRAFEPIATKLGMSIQDAASAAMRLAVANIVRAVQLVSTERGRDPRDYALLPFGGAGPLLAAEIAEELGCREVIIPPNPGVISAFGLLAADYVRVSSATHRMPLAEEAPAALLHEFTAFRQKAEREFREMGLDGELSYELTINMRFVGQAFEIPVEIDPGRLAKLRASDLADEFSSAHRRIYFHGGEPGRKVEIVGLRFGVRRRLDKLPDFRERYSWIDSSGEINVWSKDGYLATKLIRADALQAGDAMTGPAMIEGYSSTLWIPPGWRAERDEPGNIIMRKV
ncbi:hydantoinase/oxoprolinase family protein [Rhizobium leguminosarum]|uniref:hydantoinase/oxoprolinase family protein n=1 Tax=Rhizobium leguminosarum TaxID=384 RepID=UPI001C946554|nr:hydantoinase/oxoprolinase family protein [Rhizobium leguminosarum]MBY5533708.1 hydantoinase/oxoprolinase family protein [Rhizobium leguminosarum]